MKTASPAASLVSSRSDEERWADWQAKYRANDAATTRRLRYAATSVAAVAIGWIAFRLLSL